jgi:hypothetical protein
MEAQKPAEGILKTGDFGDIMFYHIHCDCGNDDDAHEMTIEADDMHVQIHVYVKVKSKWWQKKRWSEIWHLMTRGYVEMQSTIVLNEQAALNYAETIKSAVADVKAFRNQRLDKSKKT